MKIIRIKTWGCPCGFHTDREPVGILCPSCKRNEWFIETNPAKQITTTTMDDISIEAEIQQLKERKEQNRPYLDDDDVSDNQKKENYRRKRINEIRKAEQEMKKKEAK